MRCCLGLHNCWYSWLQIVQCTLKWLIRCPYFPVDFPHHVRFRAFYWTCSTVFIASILISFSGLSPLTRLAGLFDTGTSELWVTVAGSLTSPVSDLHSDSTGYRAARPIRPCGPLTGRRLAATSLWWTFYIINRLNYPRNRPSYVHLPSLRVSPLHWSLDGG